MAISSIVLTDEDNGSNRFVEMYLKDSGGNEIRLYSETIASGAPISTINLVTAWPLGVPVENGIVLWRQKEYEATDPIGRAAILAVLDVVRDNGTLAQMITAGEGAIAGNTLMNGAYNRFATALIGGTNAQRMQFIALLTTFTYSRLMQE